MSDWKETSFTHRSSSRCTPRTPSNTTHKHGSLRLRPSSRTLSTDDRVAHLSHTIPSLSALVPRDIAHRTSSLSSSLVILDIRPPSKHARSNHLKEYHHCNALARSYGLRPGHNIYPSCVVFILRPGAHPSSPPSPHRHSGAFHCLNQQQPPPNCETETGPSHHNSTSPMSTISPSI